MNLRNTNRVLLPLLYVGLTNTALAQGSKNVSNDNRGNNQAAEASNLGDVNAKRANEVAAREAAAEKERARGEAKVANTKLYYQDRDAHDAVRDAAGTVNGTAKPSKRQCGDLGEASQEFNKASAAHMKAQQDFASKYGPDDAAAHQQEMKRLQRRNADMQEGIATVSQSCTRAGFSTDGPK